MAKCLYQRINYRTDSILCKQCFEIEIIEFEKEIIKYNQI